MEFSNIYFQEDEDYITVKLKNKFFLHANFQIKKFNLKNQYYSRNKYFKVVLFLHKKHCSYTMYSKYFEILFI